MSSSQPISNPCNSIGVLGGTFDPVQNAHIAIAEEALRCGKVDKVIFIPARLNPHKLEGPSASDAHRLQMLIDATKNNSRFEVSDIELRRPEGPSYSYDTVHELRQRHVVPIKLFFIAGSDAVSGLPRWHRVHELFQELDGFLVFPRKEDIISVISALNGFFSREECRKIFPLPLAQTLQEISATEIRTRLKSNGSIGGLVPNEVETYIQEYQLYLDKL